MSTNFKELTLNIKEHPFYKAISLFESEQFKDAFPLFLLVAKQGNLYALYYLEYLQKYFDKNPKEGHSEIPKENKEEEEFLQSLPDYIKSIPERIDASRTYDPKAWLKASLKIINFNKELKKDAQATFPNSLKELSQNAPNAAVFWYDYQEKTNPTAVKSITRKLPLHLEVLLKTTDLFVLDKISKISFLSKDFLSPFEKTDPLITGLSQELEYLKTNLSLLVSLKEREGIREYFLGAYHIKMLKRPNLSLVERAKFSEFRANSWQATAAFLGEPSKQNDFAERTSIPEDALKWRIILAKKGILNSLVHLMRIYFNGENVEIDLVKAGQFAQKVIDHKDSQKTENHHNLAVAHFIIGAQFYRGEGVYSLDLNKAGYHYEQTIKFKSDYLLAHFWLAEVYFELKSYKKALLEYSEYIRLGESTESKEDIADVQRRIGEIYYQGGDDIPQDIKQAMNYWLMASEHNPEAKGKYWYYNHVDPNTGFIKLNSPKETIPSLIEAANQGSFTASYAIANWYLTNELPSVYSNNISIKTLKTYLQTAIKHPTLQARIMLLFGVFYYLYATTVKEYEQGLSNLQKIANGDLLSSFGTRVTATVFLGQCYRDGHTKFKIKPDLEKARNTFRLADRLKSSTGSLYYASFLLEYSQSLDKDISEIIFSLEYALSKGALEAAYRLNFIYRFGKGGTQINLQRAFGYLIQAEDLNENIIWREIGECYLNGIGVKRDKDKANEYFGKIRKAGGSLPTLYYWHLKLAEGILNKIGSSDMAFSQEIINDLKTCSDASSNINIFFQIIFDLLTETTQDKITDAIKKLEDCLAKEPHSHIADFLELLKERQHLKEHPLEKNQPSLLQNEILLFVLLIQNSSILKPLAIIRKCYEKDAKPMHTHTLSSDVTQPKNNPVSQNEASLPKQSTISKTETQDKPKTLPETNKERAPIVSSFEPRTSVSSPEKKDTAEKEKLDRLVQWFTHTKNTKHIDLADFQTLVDEISNYGNIPYEFKDTKKGFMYQVKPEKVLERIHDDTTSNRDPITFSTHRAHGPDKKDPKVGKSMQVFVEQFAELADIKKATPAR